MRFQPPQWFDSLPSTNTWLADVLRAGEPLPAGYVVAAREQTAGRGRLDRQWNSGEAGENLAFSFVARPAAPPARAASIGLAVALGAAEALEALGAAPRIKWPNDLLIRGRKICGILAEWIPLPPAQGKAEAGALEDAGAASGGDSAIVIGAGVNVNLPYAAAQRLDRPATSLRIELGRAIPPETVLETILRCLSRPLDAWEAGGFPAIRAEWERRALAPGERITAHDHGRLFEGLIEGYDDSGALLARDTATGQTRRVTAGEILPAAPG